MPAQQIVLAQAFTDTTMAKLPKVWTPDLTKGGLVASAGATGNVVKSSELSPYETNVYQVNRTDSAATNNFLYYGSDAKPSSFGTTVPLGTTVKVLAYARAQAGAVALASIGINDIGSGSRNVLGGDKQVTASGVSLTSTLTLYTVFNGPTLAAWDTQAMRVAFYNSGGSYVGPAELDIAIYVLAYL